MIFKTLKNNLIENSDTAIPLWLQWLDPISYAKNNSEKVYQIEECDINETDLENFKKELFLKLKVELVRKKN